MWEDDLEGFLLSSCIFFYSHVCAVHFLCLGFLLWRLSRDSMQLWGWCDSSCSMQYFYFKYDASPRKNHRPDNSSFWLLIKTVATKKLGSIMCWVTQIFLLTGQVVNVKLFLRKKGTKYVNIICCKPWLLDPKEDLVHFIFKY